MVDGRRSTFQAWRFYHALRWHGSINFQDNIRFTDFMTKHIWKTNKSSFLRSKRYSKIQKVQITIFHNMKKEREKYISIQSADRKNVWALNRVARRVSAPLHVYVLKANHEQQIPVSRSGLFFHWKKLQSEFLDRRSESESLEALMEFHPCKRKFCWLNCCSLKGANNQIVSSLHGCS